MVQPCINNHLNGNIGSFSVDFTKNKQQESEADVLNIKTRTPNLCKKKKKVSCFHDTYVTTVKRTTVESQNLLATLDGFHDQLSQSFSTIPGGNRTAKTKRDSHLAGRSNKQD